jgi:hypothetical protein
VKLIAEIRRRKVFRVAVVYGATAFAVLQAADIILPRIGVPDWGMSLVVVLLVLGLPVALVLAWALEVTPDGVRVTRSATATSGETKPPALLGVRTIAVAALLLAVGVGFGAGRFLGPRTAADAAGSPRNAGADGSLDRSVAVLPFADFSPDGGTRRGSPTVWPRRS